MVKNYKLGNILYKIMRYVENNAEVDLSDIFLTENKYFACNINFKRITFSELTDAYFWNI